MKTILTISLAFFATICFCTLANAQTPAQNKQTTAKIMAAVDAGDITSFAMYLSPSMVEHLPAFPGTPATSSDYEKAKATIAIIHAAFPDSKTEVINTVAEGDMVVVHSYFNATNSGSFLGMPPTNKKVHIEQVDIVRFDANGKCVEHWGVMDQLVMMQQLGLMPADGK